MLLLSDQIGQLCWLNFSLFSFSLLSFSLSIDQIGRFSGKLRVNSGLALHHPFNSTLVRLVTPTYHRIVFLWSDW